MPIFRRPVRLAVLLCLLIAAPLHAQSPTPTPLIHTVAPGESLVRIAQQYGVRWQAIADVNGITDINRLLVGQRLIIPSPSDATFTATASPTASATATTSTPIVLTLTPTPTIEIPAATATQFAASGALDLAPTIQPPPPLLVPVSTIVLNTPTIPTETPTITPTFTLTLTTTPPPPSSVNGLNLNQFILMDEATRTHVREIYARGVELARNPHAFSKVGDSTIENPFFMTRFDGGDYNLGAYTYLQRVIDYYDGSFERDSVAVQVGLHSWSAVDPMWGDPYQCPSGDSPIACEIRLHNPSVMFIRLGSNDRGVPELFERSLRALVEMCILNGVIPIIGTKADRFDGAQNINNEIMRRLASEYHVPLWDFDVLAGTIPGRGLLSDGVHMTTFYAHDWRDPAALMTGHGVHSLTALMMLDSILNTLEINP